VASLDRWHDKPRQHTRLALFILEKTKLTGAGAAPLADKYNLELLSLAGTQLTNVGFLEFPKRV